MHSSSPATTAALSPASFMVASPRMASSESPPPSSVMLDALQSRQPQPALAAKLQLYGQFVGSWDVDIDYFPPDGPIHCAKAEWHFSWVLDGRAVQDVFIFPARAVRAGKPDEPWYFYGSTFRWYDPGIDAWHINYFEPTRPFQLIQIGRAVGLDIVQISDETNGLVRRWRFVEITPRSFRWIGEASPDKGASWTLEMDIHTRRGS